jgi:hypothetical protein
MNRQHEQKHLLYHRRSCRYCDRPQTPWAVLRVGVASGSQRLIPTGERSGLLTHIATTETGSFVQADKKPTMFVEVEWAIRACGELP